MPVPSMPALQSAWAALWTPRSPFNLPRSLEKKTRVGFSWFRPLEPVPMPETGPVVVLNSSAFGIVTVNLHNATLADLDMVTPGAITFDPATGTVTAELSFAAIKYAGDYEVRRGRASGDALKAASRALMNHPIFTSLASDGDDANVTLAKSYQPQLTKTANGQTMLNSYYTHNAAYADAFTNTYFAGQWATQITSNADPNQPAMGTVDCANNTAAAAQQNSTSYVNSTDGSTANLNFQAQSFSMQGMLVSVCNAMSNQEAATAASCFGDNTQDPSNNPQTAGDVMNMVSTSTPQGCPSSSSALDGPASSTHTLNLLTSHPKIAPWRRAIYERDLHHYEAIAREEEDVRRGIILREETNRAIHSGFRSYIAAPSLKLVGRFAESPDAAATIQFTSIQGSLPGVEVTLGAFPGKLHPELSAAVAKAGFLKSVLARQATNALAASPLLTHVGRMLSLALAGEPAAIR